MKTASSCLAFLFACLSSWANPTLAADRPNFLLIFTDDHGYGDVSTYHDSDVTTPNIDRIAADGMLFTAMRANCTVCSPSRDGKQSNYDGGLRVPFMVRWPGHVSPGSQSEYAGLNFDPLPTYLELAGAKTAAPAAISAG